MKIKILFLAIIFASYTNAQKLQPIEVIKDKDSTVSVYMLPSGDFIHFKERKENGAYKEVEVLKVSKNKDDKTIYVKATISGENKNQQLSISSKYVGKVGLTISEEDNFDSLVAKFQGIYSDIKTNNSKDYSMSASANKIYNSEHNLQKIFQLLRQKAIIFEGDSIDEEEKVLIWVTDILGTGMGTSNLGPDRSTVRGKMLAEKLDITFNQASIESLLRLATICRKISKQQNPAVIFESAPPTKNH